MSAPGACTQPELCTCGLGARCFPSLGYGSQTESSNTNVMRILCFSATLRNCSNRSRNAFESSCQTRLCKKTRMVFIPSDSAQPSSRSIVAMSKVSFCHISSSFIAMLGIKLLPTSHGCDEYQRVARSVDHFPAPAVEELELGATPEKRTKDKTNQRAQRIPNMPSSMDS